MIDTWSAYEASLHRRWWTWFRDDALPLWRQRGFAQAPCLAVERLDLASRPDRAAPLRVRTQARQIYTFAHAAQLGVDDEGATLVAPVLEALARHAYAPDGAPGWVHVLHPDGTIADATRDLYDHAFVLLMLGHAHAARVNPMAKAWLERTLQDVDRLFHAPHGGYAETAAGTLPRRQNPHMHLFEALLALFEQSGDSRFLARAGELYGLFRTRFVDEATGSLREHFALDWGLLPNGRSDVLEPGHHMEWVWLLRRYERLTGRPVEPLASALLARGERLGLHPRSQGFVVDETDGRGHVRADSRRLWSQTEYLKALVVQGRATADPALYARAATLTERLFQTYLAGVPAGAWRDRFTVAGELAVDHVPASTLYHLFGVLAELEHGRKQAGAAPETGPRG